MINILSRKRPPKRTIPTDPTALDTMTETELLEYLETSLMDAGHYVSDMLLGKVKRDDRAIVSSQLLVMLDAAVFAAEALSRKYSA